METLLIGKKMTKKRVIKQTLVMVLLMMYWSIAILLFKKFGWINNDLLFYVFCLIFVIVILFSSLSIVRGSYIEVTNTHLAFNEAIQTQQVYSEVYALFFSKYYRPSIYIDLNGIRAIQLNYKKVLVMQRKTYLLSLKCLLNDGTIITITPKGIVSKSGDYLKLIELLEKNNIPVYDPHHLKQGLEGENLYFQNYVQTLERGVNEHD